MNFKFHLPTKIIFGCGKLKKLQQFVSDDVKNIFIVTDKNILEKSGARDIVLDQLKDCKINIFDEVEENPSFTAVKKGTKLAKENEAQLVLGLGGGSAMDAAKGIAALASNDGSLDEYITGKDFSNDPLPIICIPTTSGTGSEVTPYAVFSDEKELNKSCLSNPKIFPKISIIDPTLTYSMPDNVIINTGLDVLTHATEAYLSLLSFQLSDTLAIHSINMVLENLIAASTKDKNAMNNMAYTSMLAGMTISHTSTILLHIMAYPLTTYHHIPHGKANAILLPAFINFMNRKSYLKNKLMMINSLFKKFGGIENYLNRLNISTTLSTYDIEIDEFDKFAQDTIVKDDIKITPVEISKEDIIEIYRSTF